MTKNATHKDKRQDKVEKKDYATYDDVVVVYYYVVYYVMGALGSAPKAPLQEEEEDHNNKEGRTERVGRRQQKKRAGKKKHKCVVISGGQEFTNNETPHHDRKQQQHILHRKSILQVVWTLPKRLRMSWRLLFDSKKDGTSFAKLVETLTAVDATSFCIAVEVKEPRSGHPEIFGACVVFPKGQGLKANATEWRKYGATAESYLFTFPREHPAGRKRQPKKYLASATTDGHFVWCCRDMASSERFPNGLAFGGKEYPIKHFAMHIDEHMETLTTRKTGATYEGWGSPKRDSDDVEPFFQPIENETLTIERVEVWQMDVDDEREEKLKKKNNIVAEMDGSAALAKRMVGKKEEGGVLSEKYREARFLANVGSTRVTLE